MSDQTAIDREALATLAEHVQEIRRAHRDKDSPDYNECETAECAWCEDTQRALATLYQAPEGTSAEPAVKYELLPPQIEWDLARAGEPSTKAPAPPAAPTKMHHVTYPCGCSRDYCPTHRPSYVTDGSVKKGE